MLTNREKRLLYLLIVVVVIMATGIFFFFRYSDLVEVESQIKIVTTKIQKILTDTPNEESIKAKIAALEKEIATSKEMFYKADEMDLSTFSTIVREMMEANGLTVSVMRRESKPKLKYVDFQLEGTAYNLARFLYAVYTNNKYWTIADLNVSNKNRDGKKMDFTIRIMYEVYSPDNN